MAAPRLILASASPRRSELLRGLGLAFEVIPSTADESGPPGDPRAFALAVARAKATEVAARAAQPPRVVLAADTIVVLGDRIFGKPREPAEAAAMLEALSGREHTVITAFCLLSARGELLHEEAVETRVRFKALTPHEIRSYVATGEPMDKAGAYAAQGVGMFLVRSVTGSYANVVGLPVCEVVEALERLGIVRLFPGDAAR
jgi:septum formation protein